MFCGGEDGPRMRSMVAMVRVRRGGFDTRARTSRATQPTECGRPAGRVPTEEQGRCIETGRAGWAWGFRQAQPTGTPAPCACRRAGAVTCAFLDKRTRNAYRTALRQAQGTAIAPFSAGRVPTEERGRCIETCNRHVGVSTSSTSGDTRRVSAGLGPRPPARSSGAPRAGRAARTCARRVRRPDRSTARARAGSRVMPMA